MTVRPAEWTGPPRQHGAPLTANRSVGEGRGWARRPLPRFRFQSRSVSEGEQERKGVRRRAAYWGDTRYTFFNKT